MTSEEIHAERTRLIREAIEQSVLRPGAEHPCPYRAGQTARNLVFRAAGAGPGVYRSLMDLNFRRSGNVFYRPSCPQCSQCRNLRVPAAEFTPNRTQRRCWTRNQDVVASLGIPEPTPEKHELYQRYVRHRHGRKGDESWNDFREFLYDSPRKTREVTFRVGSRLVAVGIVDLEIGALSTVYCYYDPGEAARSPGIFNILWSIDHCRRNKIPYVYLGYYIRDCPKMNYKLNYRPCELLDEEFNWRRFER